MLFKKVFHTLVVFFLSALLIFGSTAKEYVHLFAHHEDTVHIENHICPDGETHLDHEHHHCSFLHFVLEPFANDAFFVRSILPISIAQCIKIKVYSTEYFLKPLIQKSSRGPPTI